MINNNLTRQQIVFINSILVVWSLGMAWLSLKGGVQHDYKAYITQWQLLLNGDPPWSTNNAYAPVHVVIGYLLPLHDLAPKFLFVISMLAANYLLVQDLLTIRGFDRINLVYLLCIPANILFIGMGIIYGLNDGFVAALLVFAVLLKLRSHSKLTGLFIGLAALMKFYPILLLPFFALDYKKINYEIIISGIVTFVAGFVAALIVWGTGPIAPVVFNSSRGPSLLSVLLALRTTFGETGIINFLIQYNTFFVIAGIIGTFAYIWCKNYSWLEGVVLGYFINHLQSRQSAVLHSFSIYGSKPAASKQQFNRSDGCDLNPYCDIFITLPLRLPVWVRWIPKVSRLGQVLRRVCFVHY